MRLLKNKGIVFWITGLSGSGKTAIAEKIKKDISNKYGPTMIISGDDLRNIFGYKKFAYGIQFHVEIRNTTVDDCAAVPEYKNALEQSLGSEALPEMKNAVNAEISTMQDQCKMLYQNFLKIISD